MKARKYHERVLKPGGRRRFNGAAPMKARKWPASPTRPFPLACFNGAAPMKARKWRKRLRSPSACSMLQWSRADEGAEMAWRDG